MIPAKSHIYSTASAFFLIACGNTAPAAGNAAALEDASVSLAPDGWADASAQFSGTDGETKGRVLFADSPAGGLLMRVHLENLSQGWHGIHLHQVGDCSDHGEGFQASGGHIDPGDRAHGLLNAEGPEHADLPNIYAGADGVAMAEIYNPSAALRSNEQATGLLDGDGFAVIVHENPDDHTTQPIGGAGARVACAAVNDLP
jgi:Cu-Zn family superoxide dismutase